MFPMDAIKSKEIRWNLTNPLSPRMMTLRSIRLLDAILVGTLDRLKEETGTQSKWSGIGLEARVRRSRVRRAIPKWREQKGIYERSGNK